MTDKKEETRSQPTNVEDEPDEWCVTRFPVCPVLPLLPLPQML